MFPAHFPIFAIFSIFSPRKWNFTPKSVNAPLLWFPFKVWTENRRNCFIWITAISLFYNPVNIGYHRTRWRSRLKEIPEEIQKEIGKQQINLCFTDFIDFYGQIQLLYTYFIFKLRIAKNRFLLVVGFDFWWLRGKILLYKYFTDLKHQSTIFQSSKLSTTSSSNQICNLKSFEPANIINYVIEISKALKQTFSLPITVSGIKVGSFEAFPSNFKQFRTIPSNLRIWKAHKIRKFPIYIYLSLIKWNPFIIIAEPFREANNRNWDANRHFYAFIVERVLFINFYV